MNEIDRKRVLHELTQGQLQVAASDMYRHLERIKIEPFTRAMVEGLLMAFMASNKLNGELFEEIERLKGVTK